MKNLPVMRIESTILDHANVIAICAFLHEFVDYCNEDKQYKFEFNLSAQGSDFVEDDEPPF